MAKSGPPTSSMSLDEARLLANVNERAQRLYEDGYRIRRLDTHRYLIRSEKGGTYTVSSDESTVSSDKSACTCPFFEKHGGHYPCNHTLGWKKLLLTQRAAIQALMQHWESIPLGESITQAVLEQLQKHGGQPPCL